jgi:hypothetical protein
MCSYHEPDWQDAQDQADALSVELARLGFTTTVYTKGGHSDYPCVQVQAGRWQLEDTIEYIYVAPHDDGVRMFLWSSLEPIAPATEVSKAADIVARRLAAIPRAGIRAL